MGNIKKLMIKQLFYILLISHFISVSYGYSTARKIGDVMQLALPITALSSTYYINDTDGTKSFFKSYLTTVSMTYVIKELSQKRRPDGSDYLSFPSGHTSSAFAGASFVHFRYGFKYSIPLYFLASFTGYSRVESDKHYVEDVLAGAGLAILSSWYFTSPYNKNTIGLGYDPKSNTIQFNLIKYFK